MKFTLMGTVLNTFISNNQTSLRVEKDSLQVDKKGILTDKYYDKNLNRSILITSKESYIMVSSFNISMPFGSLGENLLIDYNPYHLKAGDRLKIGEVTLEISQNCTICEHLSSIDERLPTLLKEDRGIFAKVIVGGKIKVGDEIYLKM